METASAQLLRKAHATSDVDDLVNIGCDLADSDEAGAAVNLGNCLAGQERFREAVDAYELALERGETDAWLNLGMVLDDLGDLAGAMRAYEQAERAGDSGGAVMLAFTLREQGERDAAFEAMERAEAAGHELAAAVLAGWRWCTSLDPVTWSVPSDTSVRPRMAGTCWPRRRCETCSRTERGSAATS